ncbi:hypothetical protein D5R55_20305 [Burkholderia cenocepacia]|uniref:Uncharacterized protein n=1 Tax=Burkholderia cenocepacia TaxID=95486 RepID=A0A3Q9F5T6_9BURK|nr:hypothetical protein D5R55_20305 [Burkholderia cenocepacia]
MQHERVPHGAGIERQSRADGSHALAHRPARAPAGGPRRRGTPSPGAPTPGAPTPGAPTPGAPLFIE